MRQKHRAVHLLNVFGHITHKHNPFVWLQLWHELLWFLAQWMWDRNKLKFKVYLSSAEDPGSPHYTTKSRSYNHFPCHFLWCRETANSWQLCPQWRQQHDDTRGRRRKKKTQSDKKEKLCVKWRRGNGEAKTGKWQEKLLMKKRLRYWWWEDSRFPNHIIPVSMRLTSGFKGF